VTIRRLLLDRSSGRGASLRPRNDSVFRALVDGEWVWSAPDGERVDPVTAVDAVQRHLA